MSGKDHDIGPGPGNALLWFTRRRQYSANGFSESYDLPERTSILPLPYKQRMEEDEDGHVEVQVLWDGVEMGRGEIELPKGVEDIYLTVEVAPGIRHDVGPIPFSPSEVVRVRDRRGEIVRDSEYIRGFPCWSWEFCLVQGKAEHSFCLISRDAPSPWIALWSAEYEKCFIALYDDKGMASRPLSQKTYTRSGKILIRLDESSSLGEGDEISGLVYAYDPQLAEDTPLRT